MPLSINQLEPRLRPLVAKWHPALRSSFRRYLASTSLASSRAEQKRSSGDPYWFLLPQWLYEQFRRNGGVTHRFLTDALWGQFCAFLAVKMEDDLFDGHVEDRSLLYAANHCLLNAREAFVPYFGTGSSFWPFFDSSLRQTLNAIIAMDQSQLHGFESRASVEAIVKQGYAVCNIATYALCHRLKRIRLYETIVRCTNELAIVGQLLDDLEDMETDFRRSRVNYAAFVLSGGSSHPRRNFSGRLVRGIILDGLADRFFEMLQGHLERAWKIAGTTEIRRLEKYIKNYSIELESLGMQVHKSRVRLLFDPGRIRNTHPNR